MTYPAVLSELQTLEAALAGRSLSRFGDGELSLALGGDCVSQVRDPALAAELKAILAIADPRWLTCIPNVKSTSRPEGWAKYGTAKYLALYGQATYGSSFITRPDSAAWIDTPAFWGKLAELWAGKDVVLAKGTERSLRSAQLTGAASVKEIGAPRRDAYAVIDQIEEEIGRPSIPVLLCLGPTATVLAVRLARKGVHAIDLGHVGMFLRHAGAYRYTRDDFVSPKYRAELAQMHKQTRWGNDGKKHLEEVYTLAMAQKAATILDYGCGEGGLKRSWNEAGLDKTTGVRVMEYDPGMDGKEGLPKPCDLVVCTDVLEHVEPEKLDAVIDHLCRITGAMAYVVIATRKANAVLPSGRNAHLTVQPWPWWEKKLHAHGFKVERVVEREGKDVSLCLTK